VKTLGRILIILLAAALVTGAWLALVNGVGTNLSTSFERRGQTEFRPPQRDQAPAGSPEYSEGMRPGREESRGGGLSLARLTAGLVKNVGVMAVLVAVVVLPKSLLDRRRKKPHPQSG
jgi:hypothetical protein